MLIGKRVILLSILITLLAFSAYAATPVMNSATIISNSPVTLQGYCNASDTEHLYYNSSTMAAGLTYDYEWYKNDALYSSGRTPGVLTNGQFKSLNKSTYGIAGSADLILTETNIYYKTNLSIAMITPYSLAAPFHGDDKYLYGHSGTNIIVLNGTTGALIANLSASVPLLKGSLYSNDAYLYISNQTHIAIYSKPTFTFVTGTSITHYAGIWGDGAYLYVGVNYVVEQLNGTTLSWIRNYSVNHHINPANGCNQYYDGRCLYVDDNYIYTNGVGGQPDGQCLTVYDKTTGASVFNGTCYYGRYGMTGGEDFVCVAEHQSVQMWTRCWKKGTWAYSDTTQSGTGYVAYTVWLSEPYYYVAGSATSLYSVKTFYNSSVQVNPSNLSGLLTAGDTWKFSCNARDPVTSSGWLNSSVYTVPSSNITVNSARISPVLAFTNDTLLGYCNATEPYGDRLAYEGKWYVNNTLYNSSFTQITLVANETKSVSVATADVWGNDKFFIVGGAAYWKYDMSSYRSISGTYWTGNNDRMYGGASSTLYIYDGSDLSSIQNITGFSGTIYSLDIDDDLLVIGTSTSVYVYNATTMTLLMNNATPSYQVLVDDDYIYVRNSTRYMVVFNRGNLTYQGYSTIHATTPVLTQYGHKMGSSDDELYLCIFDSVSNDAMEIYNKSTLQWKSTVYGWAGPNGMCTEDDINFYFPVYGNPPSYQEVYIFNKATHASTTVRFNTAGGWQARSLWNDDMRLYAGTSGTLLMDIYYKRTMYNSGTEQNTYNISSSALHAGDSWVFECVAHNLISTTSGNSSRTIVGPIDQPTLTQNGFPTFEKEMSLGNTTTFTLDIFNNYPYASVTYDVSHNFNESCFGVGFERTQVISEPAASNTTNVTITVNGTSDCYAQHYASILVTDYFGNTTAFPVTLTVNATYVEIIVYEPDIMVTPAGWACAKTADINATCTKEFNITNTGTGACNSSAIVDGFNFTYNPFSLEATESKMVTVSTSVPLGSFEGYIDVSCGNSHYYDVFYSFEIIKQASGGSSGEIREIQKIANLTNYCGDGICQETENPSNCWQDCKVNIDTMFVCIWDKNIQCNWEQNWFPTAILIFLVAVTVVVIYKYDAKKRK